MIGLFSFVYGQNKNVEYINAHLKTCNSYSYTFEKVGKSYVLSGKYYEITLEKKKVKTTYESDKEWIVFSTVDGSETLKRIDKDDGSYEEISSYEINYDCADSGEDFANAFNKLLKVKK